MNDKVYVKEDKIETIFEFKAGHFDKKMLEEEVVEFYEKIDRWKNLLEIEVGYSPVETKEECPWYSMPMIKIMNHLDDSEDGILRHEAAHRNQRVDEWNMYYKITLKKKNPMRNIESLVKIFKGSLEEEKKEKIKKLIKEQVGEIQI